MEHTPYSSVATAFIFLCIAHTACIVHARNFSSYTVIAPVDAQSLYQLINPNAVLLPPLQRPCSIMEAVTFARRTVIETDRMFDLCCSHNRWHFDEVRQACQHHCSEPIMRNSAHAVQKVRHEIDAHWNHLHDAHLESVHDQMNMADRAVQMFEASLMPWLWSAMEQQILKLKESIAQNIVDSRIPMVKIEQKLERILDNFEVMFEGRSVGYRSDLIEQTMDAVADVLEETEMEIRSIHRESFDVFRESMRCFGFFD